MGRPAIGELDEVAPGCQTLLGDPLMPGGGAASPDP